MFFRSWFLWFRVPLCSRGAEPALQGADPQKWGPGEAESKLLGLSWSH